MKVAHLVGGQGERPRVVVWTLLIISLSVGFLLNSCSKETEVKKAGPEGMAEHAMLAGWKFSWPKGSPDEGRKLFAKLECYKCHEIRGESFPKVSEKEQGVGPELTQMAGLHPLEFYAESIINPDAFLDKEDKNKGYLGADGKSKMPDYNDVLTVKQVSDLASYLSSLKEQKHAGH
jgi:mono/diheme cytochrome c family protein